MLPTFVQFKDLKARGIVSNWRCLLNWIEREGFPPGKKLSPRTRAWTEDEVADWLADRPLPHVKSKSEETLNGEAR